MKKTLLFSLISLLCINLNSYSQENDYNKYLEKARSSSKKLLGT